MLRSGRDGPSLALLVRRVVLVGLGPREPVAGHERLAVAPLLDEGLLKPSVREPCVVGHDDLHPAVETVDEVADKLEQTQDRAIVGVSAPPAELFRGGLPGVVGLAGLVQDEEPRDGPAFGGEMAVEREVRSEVVPDPVLAAANHRERRGPGRGLRDHGEPLEVEAEPVVGVLEAEGLSDRGNAEADRGEPVRELVASVVGVELFLERGDAVVGGGEVGAELISGGSVAAGEAVEEEVDAAAGELPGAAGFLFGGRSRGAALARSRGEGGVDAGELGPEPFCGVGQPGGCRRTAPSGFRGRP